MAYYENARPLRYFCCEMDLTDRGRYFADSARNGFAKLDLLKTEVLASLYRLEGALDAAGDC